MEVFSNFYLSLSKWNAIAKLIYILWFYLEYLNVNFLEWTYDKKTFAELQVSAFRDRRVWRPSRHSPFVWKVVRSLKWPWNEELY